MPKLMTFEPLSQVPFLFSYKIRLQLLQLSLEIIKLNVTKY